MEIRSLIVRVFQLPRAHPDVYKENRALKITSPYKQNTRIIKISEVKSRGAIVY